MHEGISIVCDDTVRGAASFRYLATDFSQAFDAFLSSARLYVKKTETEWIVSKVHIDVDENNGISLRSFDTRASVLFEKLSQATGIMISYDVLPMQELSVHIKNVQLEKLIALILKGLGDYEINSYESYIEVSKKTTANRVETEQWGIVEIYENSNEPFVYNAHIEKASIQYAIETLFSKTNFEFVQSIKGSPLIDTVYVFEKSFDEILRLCCLQTDSDYIKKDGVYYFYANSDARKMLSSLFTEYNYCALKYKTVPQVLSVLKEQFPAIISIQENDYAFFYLCDISDQDKIRSTISLLDKPSPIHVLRLQHMKVKDFLSVLPPMIRKEDFFETGKDSDLYFIGSDKSLEQVKEVIARIDKPEQRIRYDLLIVQFQETSSSSLSPTLKLGPTELGDSFLTRVQMDSVLDLQTNIVSSLGLTFAAGLQAQVKENKAKVFADTSLYGVSGKPIQFQNTSTYRYRELVVDQETGKISNTGITREIVSGLVLDIEGWVSGDRMIETNVSATVSKRGADVSTGIGNPPPTYEKIITTSVLGRSGESVVLSGLVQDDSVLVQDRVPFISKIPLLGKLFKSSVKTNEKTEMVIYLIPHLEDEGVFVKEGIDFTRDSKSINEDLFYTYVLKGGDNGN